MKDRKLGDQPKTKDILVVNADNETILKAKGSDGLSHKFRIDEQKEEHINLKGEKEYVITLDDMTNMQTCIGMGLSKSEVAQIFNIDVVAFNNMLSKNKVLREYLAQGRAVAKKGVMSILYQQAIAGDSDSCWKWLHFFGGVVDPNKLNLQNEDGSQKRLKELTGKERFSLLEETYKTITKVGIFKREEELKKNKAKVIELQSKTLIGSSSSG